MVLYPFSLFYLVLPLPWSLSIFCLGHLVLAGTGMYRLALQWTDDRIAATGAGTGFVFNGITLSCLMWPNYTVALGWMPWVVLLVERTWRDDRSLRPIALAAVVATLQMLSGVPEIIGLTWLVVAVLWVSEALRSSLNSAAESDHGVERATPSLAALISRPGLVIALTAAMAAAQLTPFLQLLAHSQRTGSAATLKWALPSWGWGTLFNPMFRCAQNPQGIFFQIGQEFFGSTYLGVVLLSVALLGAAVVRNRRVWLLAGLAGFGLLMAYGDHGPVYRALRTAFPPLGFMRYPVKFMLLTAFTLPLLAAYGFRALRVGTGTELDGKAALRRFIGVAGLMTVGTALTAAFTFSNPTRYDVWPVVWHSAACRIGFLMAAVGFLGWGTRSRSGTEEVKEQGQGPGEQAGVGLGLRAQGETRAIAAAALTFVVLADALVAVPQKNPVLPASVMAPGLWELGQHLRAPKLGEGRVVISPQAEEQLLTSTVRDLKTDFLFKRLALWSNLNLLEQIPKVNGSSTLQVGEQKQIESVMYGTIRRDLSALSDFLGASHATAPGQVFQSTNRAGSLPLLTAGQKPVFANLADTLNAVTSTNFNPRELVYLPLEAKAVAVSSNSSGTKVESTHWAAHQIDVEIEGQAPSWVVIAQSFYPSWRASVDGTPTKLWRANGAYQALEVPRGRHRVRLEYVDGAFRAGMGISVMGLLACGLLCWPPGGRTSVGFRRRRTQACAHSEAP
jgi:hypothetical protein